MLFLDHENILHQTGTGILRSSGALYALDAHRIRSLLIAAVYFITARAGLHLFAAFDRVFFPQYRRINPQRPIFVIGNFRTGTTVLFNMLAAAPEHTTAFKTWQIYAAPTISQRKLVRLFKSVDRVLLGGIVGRLLGHIDLAFLQQIPLHPIRMLGPEEDAGLFLYAWSGFFTWFLFPSRARSTKFLEFDSLPLRYRRRMVRYYREMVQRHLYDASQGGRRPVPTFVSKNPSYSCMIRSLLMEFPDARFIHARRRYDAMYRSTLRWFQYWAVSVGDRSGPVRTDLVTRMTRHWDRYPIEVFRKNPSVLWSMASLEEIRDAPEQVLRRLSAELDLKWLSDPAMFNRTLAAIDADYGSQAAIDEWLRRKRPRLIPIGPE